MEHIKLPDEKDVPVMLINPPDTSSDNRRPSIINLKENEQKEEVT